MPSCVLLLPGDLDTPTGGYRYDRRLVAELRMLGWQVQVVSLAGDYPQPDAAARADAEALVAALPDGAVVIADGLAFGALPEVARRHARRLRWVALVHHPLGLETGLGPNEAEALLESERRALVAARGIVVTSAATAGLMARLALVPGRDGTAVTVIEPGCDLLPIAPAPSTAAHDAVLAYGVATASGPEEPAAPPTIRLLCVASVTPRKGHRVLLEALTPLARPGGPAWTLDCIGSLTMDPREAQAVRDLAVSCGLQGRVRWHGAVDAEALPAHYRRADLFVLPSLFEGYGMVVAEALAQGLPVLASDTGAARPLLGTGGGLCLPPGDVPAWRAALSTLLADAPQRARLRQSAREARARLPSWRGAAARWDKLLRLVAVQPCSPEAASD